MYLSFRDLVFCILKALILTIIFVSLVALGELDYHLGIGYCNLMKIPKDFAISMFSPGMAIEFGIVLFVFEIIGLYFIVKLIRRNKYIDNFCEFLYIEI